MLKWFKKIPHLILTKEINEREDFIKDLVRENTKLKKEIRKITDPENILLSHYRIDNVSSVDGTPPSFFNKEDKNEYTKKLSEINSVYHNGSFRELMAWSLNFHANLAVSGKVKNQEGDTVEIPTEQARYIIAGIRAIWELVVVSHVKDRELRDNKNFDPYESLDD